MSVYVDDMDMDFRRMRMSHLMADTTEELLAMVDKIKVQRKWIQYPGTPREHFDICMSKKKKALAAGTIQTTWREVGIWETFRMRYWPLHMTFEEAMKRHAAECGDLVETAKRRPSKRSLLDLLKKTD